MTLEVPGFGTSLLSLPRPLAELSAEPLVVAAHGAGDNATSQCETWREIIGSCGAILCPAGTPIGPGRNNGYYFTDHHRLEAEVLASLAAVQQAYQRQLSTDQVVYVAYSQGASMGSLMLSKHGNVFRRLVLVEGGDAHWSVKSARQFKHSGGERVLFVCGTASCAKNAARSVEWLSTTGLTARFFNVPGGGHAYWGKVAEALQLEWPWVVEGDPRWGVTP